jgi:hypothetical protein
VAGQPCIQRGGHLHPLAQPQRPAALLAHIGRLPRARQQIALPTVSHLRPQGLQQLRGPLQRRGLHLLA